MSATPTNGNGFTQRYGVIIQTVMVVALFGAAIWTGVLSPMIESLRKLQVDINSDHAWTQKQDVQIKHLEEGILRIDARHESHVVPRSEMTIRLDTISNQQALLAERINDVRKSVSSQVTPGDEIKRLQAEIAELRRVIYEKK